MNPYNRIHHNKLKYTCCICKSTNYLNTDYLIDKENYPPEVDLEHSSFLLAKRVEAEVTTMGFLFVIDITLEAK